MSLRELVCGRALRTDEEQAEEIGIGPAVPVLGLDALASASYGPEAALTILLPLGALSSGYIGPITAAIIAVLLAVALSYRQTIPAYPGGGGSFTVAKENLGRFAGLLAASALSIDYVLNVAVAISAGVGALVSVVPPLLPYTLSLCLGILAILTVVNLRGLRTAGLILMLPTYLFVFCLGLTIVLGAVKTVLAHGHPLPVTPPPKLPVKLPTAGLWLLLRGFASGCTALTGVEAVSNAVPIFREPRVKLARRTLTVIMSILAFLLAGVAFLSQSYGIGATPQGQAGYQSVLSELVGAVAGRGFFYFVTMTAVLLVLALSANTSFADFPRVCRLLALDESLPAEFAHRGLRLVYSQGILLLAFLAGFLLVVFGGITDLLIPLFAVGAFLAFTLSQFGMVAHWRRRGGPKALRSLALNAVGGTATAVTLLIISVSKFTQGAWITLLVLPSLLIGFSRLRRYHERLEREVGGDGHLKLDITRLVEPIVVVPLKRLDRVTEKALRLAVTLSGEVRAVQILAEEMQTEDLRRDWPSLVEQPAREAGRRPPKLEVVNSVYREFYGPLLDYVGKLAAEHRNRPIAVMIPELVEKRWYHFIFRHRVTLLKGLLLLRGGRQILIITTPWYLEKEP
jgi:amino acid transporter